MNLSHNPRSGIAGARAVMVSTAKFHPRHMRRAQMLADKGMRVRVYAFTREWNTKYADSRDVEVIDLGPIKSGRHISRVWKIFESVNKIKRFESNELPPALRYAFGLDAAIILEKSFRSRVPLVYEVGDIRNSLPIMSITSFMIYQLERYILRRAAALVVTSPAFLHTYYQRMASDVAARTIVVENRLPSEVLARFARPTTFNPRSPIRIGVIGLFRYPDCLIPLVDAVSRRPGYELRLHGDGPLLTVLQERAALARNVHYCGPFKNPDDLPRVYEDIDISYVVYDNKDFNVRLALPNKLYESIFFGRPMIVASNTELAKRVEGLGIGMAVNPMEQGFAERLLDSLTRENLLKWSANALTLPVCMAIQDEDEVITKLFMTINTWERHRYR